MYSIDYTKRFDKDWLRTWEQNDTQLTLLFLQTGTHSYLF